MIRIVLLLLLAFAHQPACAQGGYDIYSDADLTADTPRYERRIDELLRKGLWNFMNADEQSVLSGVVIDQKLRGDGPLDAYSERRNGEPTVVLPVLSLKFIEDICVAYAWRHLHGYSLEPIDEYVAMLKYRKPEDFPDGRMPAPLEALGVPTGIVDREKPVDDLSLRFRNSAWAFILAHELGHLRFGHPGNKAVDAATSQENERAADRFAAELLNRSRTIPMGAILWFQASVAYFPNRADFQSEQEYWDWVQTGATHPVNPERLGNLAAILDEEAGAENDANQADTLRFIAEMLDGMSKILSEPDQQRLVARCAVLGKPEDLKRLEDRPCDERLEQ